MSARSQGGGRTQVKELRYKINDLQRLGTQMSNALYNWKQQERFDNHERHLMDEMVRQWDAAVRR